MGFKYDFIGLKDLTGSLTGNDKVKLIGANVQEVEKLMHLTGSGTNWCSSAHHM